MEAESLGIPTDTIKKGGGWKDRLGRLETHYLGKVPSEFARGMAGFWNRPFGLERNRVDPPLQLQQMVFPWIEDFFGESNAAWKKECLDEMNQKDESEFHEEDVETEFVEEKIRKNDASQSTSKKGKERQAVIVYQTIDAAKRGFLKLLLRCRRIILQDAAVYIILKKENDIVNTFPSPTNLFLSPQFQLFQEQVKRAISTPTNDRLQEYESLVPHIVDSQNEVSCRIAGFDQQLKQAQKNIQQDLKQEIAELKQQLQFNQQNFSRQINQLHQQYQQSLGIQQLILTNLNYLTNQQIGSIVPTPSIASNFSSFPPLASTSTPSRSMSSILPTPSISTSFTLTPVQSIASSSHTILPSSAQTEIVSSNTSTSPKSAKRKYKKKEKAPKWVNYSLN